MCIWGNTYIFPVVHWHLTTYHNSILPIFPCKRTSSRARSDELLAFCHPTVPAHPWEPAPVSASARPGLGGSDPPVPGQRVPPACLPWEPPKTQITGSWHWNKPCVILDSTANLPRAVRTTRAVWSEAEPLRCRDFSHPQVTHLITYFQEPPNLAVEGDCEMAKIIGEHEG